MPTPTKSDLWSRDIVCPDKVGSFLNAVNLSSFLKIDTEAKARSWIPPIFLYYEYRGKDKYVNAQAVYGGNGSPTIINGIIESREILTYGPPSSEVDKFINDARRGEILSAFCKIEFCLDTLCCIEMGVYDGDISLCDMHDELRCEGRLVATTHKKIKYLKDNRVIEDEAVKILNKAKDIRNALAHQYLPVGNFGIHQQDIIKYGSHLEAIDYIFNACWYYLLKAHSQRQTKTLAWLKSHKP